MNEFKDGRVVIERLNKHGYKAYFVGGSVRDYLLQQPIGDIDIATDATPEQVMSVFPHHVPIGLQHGTVLVIVNDVPYEITTFRVEEAYYDARHPSGVKFVRTLEDDLQRRDFTINAMAMDKDGNIIDLFHGQHHLKEKEIVTVGEAYDRFQEDALRIMRAFRFASTLEFRLSDEVISGIEVAKCGLKQISIERIRIELEKMLFGKKFTSTYEIMVNLGIPELLPRAVQNSISWHRLIDLPLNQIKEKGEFWALLLIVDESIQCDELVENWKLSNKEKSFVQSLLNGYKEFNQTSWTKELLYKLDECTVASLQRIILILKKENCIDQIYQRIDEYHRLPIKSRKDIVVTGTDLVKWKEISSGPWIRTLFNEIESEIVNNRLRNEMDEIREWVKIWQHH